MKEIFIWNKMQPITRNGPPAIKPFGIRPGPQARGTPVGLRLQFAGRNKHGPETGTCCRQKTANKTAVPDMLHPADYPIIKNTEVRCREPDMVNVAGINTAVQYFRYAEGSTECAQNIFYADWSGPPVKAEKFDVGWFYPVNADMSHDDVRLWMDEQSENLSACATPDNVKKKHEK